ncbi:MAG TPA: glucose 1-dehydrogenase [Anseongella sp.]|nr:glucose 1-dehydrogenase [Anseongella sp.]
MSLANKTAIITGGAKGIGAACAELFHDQGANVAILDIEAFKGGRPPGGRWLELRCDVSSGEHVRAAAEQVRREFGGLDLLVNNAGIQRYGTVTETPEETWDEVMNVNLKSLFLCARHVIPYMQERKKGVIINIASVQAFISQKNVAAYTTAKSAILGLTRSIAVDYAPEIRCVAVCPGTIDTPMLRESIALSPDPGEVLQECMDMHLLKRIGTAEEVAELVAFLCSDKAAFITGQAIRIDGGLGISIPGSKRDQ